MNIVISGVGAISSAGDNLSEHLQNFADVKREITLPSFFKTELNKPVFEVKKRYTNNKIMRTISLLYTALEEALNNAQLNTQKLKTYRVGVCIGTTVASQLNDLEFYQKYRKTKIADSSSINRYLQSNPAQAIQDKYQLTGMSLTIVNACSSGTDAIGMAMSWIEADICDIVIAGGGDELSQIPYLGFNSLGILSDKPAIPFDKNRNGLNLGEGAGILILEAEHIAQQRGQNSQIYAQAYSSSADAYHLTAPHPQGIGLKIAINNILHKSKLSPKDIAFINAHGTSTSDNDRIEGNVLAEIFGSQLKYLSTKGYTGHTLGAAGALEAVFTVAMLKKQTIYTNIGFAQQDPQIPISPITKQKNITKQFAISTSLAFGGNNSALLIARREI